MSEHSLPIPVESDPGAIDSDDPVPPLAFAVAIQAPAPNPVTGAASASDSTLPTNIKDVYRLMTIDFLSPSKEVVKNAMKKVRDYFSQLGTRVELKKISGQLLLAVTIVMNRNAQHSSTMLEALKLIQLVSSRHAESLQSMVEVGVFQMILSAMKNFANVRNLQHFPIRICLDSFGGKQTRDEDCQIFFDEDGATLLKLAMRNYPKDTKLQHRTIQLVDHLSCKSDEFRNLLFDAGIMDLVSKALRMHSDHKEVVRAGKSAMINLADVSSHEYKRARKRQKAS